MPGRAAKVTITERQQKVLVTLARSSTCPQGVAQRARMILLAFEGLDSEEIADRVGCERHAVGLWRRRWADAFDSLVLVECCETERVLIQTVEQFLAYFPHISADFSPNFGIVSTHGSADVSAASAGPRDRSAR
jgi:putative transposase